MSYAAAVFCFPKFTPKRIRKIFSYFKDQKSAWSSEINELVKAGIEEQIAHEFILWRESFPIEKYIEKLCSEGIEAISLFENRYPKLLKEITDPPPVIFVRGKLPEFERGAVSVVGTRKCTPYGIQVTTAISGDLADSGIIVVSGLAFGVDAEAHEASLEHGGITVAVLGSGVDRKHVYPSAHASLSERIINNGGAVISEYPPGFKATIYSFPARNRIIAGLSLGTVITEAPVKSGALITAKFCIDYNREVFAVPHNIISAQGTGCNFLLKNGAQLISSASEIIENLRLTRIDKIIKTLPLATNPIEEKILSLLSKEPLNVNIIIKESGLSSSSVTGSLTIMEMKGKIRNIGGMAYILA